MEPPSDTSPASAPRLRQFILLATSCINAWLLMQVVHELGHVLAGWLTGGEVLRVVLHPLTISRTDLGANPSPLIVCWAGPLFGAVAPLLPWWLARRWQFNGAFWFRFFAGFCLIANGAYLAAGAAGGIGDAGDLQKYGSPAILLYLFGAATIPAGLWMWHGLGPYFGIGPRRRTIAWGAAAGSTAAACAIVLAEVLWSSRL